MITVRRWSGREVRALREARRMSVRAFAEHLGISDRMVSKWEAGGEHIIPRPVNQEALDTSLSMSAEDVQARFTEAMQISRDAQASLDVPGDIEPNRSRGGAVADRPRYCRCGTRLSRDNRSNLCSVCQRHVPQLRLTAPDFPADFWHTPKMRDALQSRNIGNVIYAYRTHPYHGRELPQQVIAEWAGVSQAQVSRAELGPPVRNLDKLIHWANSLNIPRQLLWFETENQSAGEGASLRVDDSAFDGAEPPISLIIDDWSPEDNVRLAEQIIDTDGPMSTSIALRLAHEWLVSEPPQVIESRSGRRVGTALIEKIEGRIDQLRRMDDFVGGTDLHAAVAQEVEATVTLAREASYTEKIGKRLLSAVGELCQVAGWVASDAGYHHAAQRYYLGGATAAHAAGNVPIAANLLSSLSYQMANTGEARNAATLARSAAKGAASYATPAIQALLWERVAWAEAKSQESSRCDRALGNAADLFARSDSSNEPTWIYWLNQAEMHIMAGRCYTELSRPLRAEPLLREAIDVYDETHAREVSLYLTWLAEDYVQAHEIGQACAVATRALQLAGSVNSARINERITVVRQKLEPYRKTREVREFEELARNAMP